LLVLSFTRRATCALAALTAGGSLAALLPYRFVNVGMIGPPPIMYEPVRSPEKTTAAVAPSLASATAPAGFLLAAARHRKASRAR